MHSYKSDIRIMWFLLLFAAFLFSGRYVQAAEDYFENPDLIYEAFKNEVYYDGYEVKYGFAREESPVYIDWYGSEVCGKVERFEGIIITSETESYVQVIYKKDGEYDMGWIPKSFYQDQVRLYNGVEKQLLADGIYRMSDNNGERFYYVELTFEGNQTYSIRSIKADGCLEVKYDKNDVVTGLFWNHKNDSGAQDWKLIRAYDRIYVYNENARMYLVPRGAKSLGLTPILEDLNHQFGKNNVEEAYRTAGWEFTRGFGKNVNPYRNFLQYDPDWGKEDYGAVNGDYGGKMAAAGCGVVSITNMVYALTGELVDPMMLADFAVDNHYRVIGSGTNDDIYQAAAEEFGEAYHYRFIKRCYHQSEMRNYLRRGCVAISYVPGHYVTIADYDEETKTYLVLDSHPIPRRPTTPFGDWLPGEKLESGGLTSSCYFIFEHIN